MNQPDENTTPAEYFEQLNSNPSEHVASHAVLAMAGNSMELNKRIYGQFNIENPQGGLNVLFCTYPGGDAYLWFVEVGCFVLIALVNEKWKCIGIINVLETTKFQAILNDLANGLNIKHGYPIEHPEDFTPAARANNENPPDEENS